MAGKPLEMLFIGITGEAGSGKSRVLKYLEENYRARVVRADDVARELVKKGNACYEPYVRLFGAEAVGADGELKRDHIAARVFADPELRLKMNALIHPAVKDFLLEDVERTRLSGKYDLYFLEAALLIEEKYDKICDELWYVYASEEIRRERLKNSRGYTDKKIDDLIKSQKSEEEFRRVCRVVIDNSAEFEDTARQLDAVIEKKIITGDEK